MSQSQQPTFRRITDYNQTPQNINAMSPMMNVSGGVLGHTGGIKSAMSGGGGKRDQRATSQVIAPSTAGSSTRAASKRLNESMGFNNLQDRSLSKVGGAATPFAESFSNNNRIGTASLGKNNRANAAAMKANPQMMLSSSMIES